MSNPTPRSLTKAPARVATVARTGAWPDRSVAVRIVVADAVVAPSGVWIHATTAVPSSSIAVATSSTIAPVAKTAAVRGNDVREPMAAATLTGVAFSRSIDQAATSRAELFTDRPKRSNPGPPELTPTAVPWVASVLIARSWPVRCGTPPLAKSCTP